MSQRTMNGTGPDTVVLVNATSGSEVVLLPRGFAAGRRFTVRRIDSSVNSVTATATAPDSIDGVAADSKVIAANSEMSFVPLESGEWESFGLSSGGGGDVASVVGRTGAVTGAQILADASVAAALTAKADAAATASAIGSLAATQISSTAGGDLSGTLPSPTVAKINGVAVTGTPTTGWVPTATSPTAATWQAQATAPVTTVAGRTGAIVLAEADITGLVADLTAKADAATVTSALAAKAATTTTITAGTGLTGGGDLSTGRTLAVSYGSSAATAAQGNDARLSDTRTPTDGSVTLAKLAFDVATQTELDALATAVDAGKADKTTTITAGTGLTGGGSLSANRTLAVAYGTASGSATQGNDSRVVNAVQSATILAIVKLTQAAYDALGTPVATTLYVVVG